MPFFRVNTHAMLIEAADATAAAMIAYRTFDDHTPHEFEVAGPDEGIRQITLNSELQEEAITIAFGASTNIGGKSNGR